MRPWWPRARRWTVIGWVAVFLLTSGDGTARAQDLEALSTSLETLSQRVGPAVVQIFASGYTVGDGLSTSGAALVSRQRASRSGVILDPAGYVVTNAHVVENATRVQVQLPLAAGAPAEARSILRPRGQLVTARIVGVDRESDLAVLKVASATPLPALAFGDSDVLRSGQIVMAFGSPLGLDNSVSLGVVSAVARQLRADDPMIYVQTDASINPGNSGGPLVDTDGRVVGISTFILSQSGGSEGIGFAVPSNIARNVYGQIRRGGRVRRGEIGVRAQTITPELSRGLGLARDWGVVLADVYPEGPADAAGLRVGGVVVGLDGKPMENARQFQINLYACGVGESVRLDIVRGEIGATYTVRSIERPGDLDRFQTMVRPEEHLVPSLGILALNLSPEVARMLPGLRRAQGVVVAAASDQALSIRGELLVPGDVIHALNTRPVGSLSGLRGALDGFESGDPIVLQIERLGQLMYVTLVLE